MADREMPDEWRALWLAYCEEKERGEELADEILRLREALTAAEQRSTFLDESHRQVVEQRTDLECDIETIADAVAAALGIDGGDIDGDGDQGGIIAKFIGDIARERDAAREALTALTDATKGDGIGALDWATVQRARAAAVAASGTAPSWVES